MVAFYHLVLVNLWIISCSGPEPLHQNHQNLQLDGLMVRGSGSFSWPLTLMDFALPHLTDLCLTSDLCLSSWPLRHPSGWTVSSFCLTGTTSPMMPRGTRTEDTWSWLALLTCWDPKLSWDWLLDQEGRGLMERWASEKLQVFWGTGGSPDLWLDQNQLEPEPVKYELMDGWIIFCLMFFLIQSVIRIKIETAAEESKQRSYHQLINQ